MESKVSGGADAMPQKLMCPAMHRGYNAGVCSADPALAHNPRYATRCATVVANTTGVARSFEPKGVHYTTIRIANSICKQ